MGIFVTSDLHFHHANIIKFCNRPFKHVEDMNEALIKNINSKVGANDILFHLGDFCFQPHTKLAGIREQLNCNNIHIVLGNHDKDYYFEQTGQFASVQHYHELNIGKVNFIFFHYPLLSWNHYYRNSIMCHGHNHFGLFRMEVFENTPDSALKRRIMAQSRIDVGIDHSLSNWHPFSLDEVVDIVKKGRQNG